MSTERPQPTPERGERHEQQRDTELEAAGREKLEELRNNPEATHDNALERAYEARKTIEKAPEKEDATEAAPTAPAAKPQFILDAKQNYLQTMASVQRSLKPVSRSFSKLIHTPAIEKTSEALEKTVARPSVTAGATWTALIVGSIFYFTARHFGYTLSGSELLFSFIVGAILGLVIEALWRAYKHR